MPHGVEEDTTLDRYHGFKLSSVCWGYRDLFAETLEALFDQGVIGDARPEVTESFFSLMRCSERQHFDYVLKEFLAALNPHTAWLLDLPSLFAGVTELGREFAQSKLHYGISYFRVLGEGGFGQTPQQVQYLLDTLRKLRAVDEDLAQAFLMGYKNLVTQLTIPELEVYVKQGLRAYHQNRKTGLRFMMGTLKSSETIIRSLTQEARLHDQAHSLAAMLRALVGYEVEVADLSRLDSDELLERGTRVVCMSKWLYLPAHVRYFDSVAQNRNWYRLCAVVAAGMLLFDSFPRIHGASAYGTCERLVGDETLRLNCFQILEYVRVLRSIRRIWPGARRLLDFGIEAEMRAQVYGTAADRLFFDLVSGGDSVDGVLAQCLEVADMAVNVFDTVALLTPQLMMRVADAYPGLAHEPLRTFAFLPDFLYPAAVSQPPEDALVADLKEKARRAQEARERGKQEELHSRGVPGDRREEQEQEGKQGENGIVNAYVYDEWSQEENDYYRNYCYVYEKRPVARGPADLPPEIVSLARRTRRLFEMLRPELTKEKFLSEGDTINVDLLVDYLVQSKRMPAPRINFYEKPYHDRRDLATLILLDVSGSTGNEVSQRETRLETIELEKQAALVLGHGLAALGDRFAICGFSGNGREQCEFFVFKDFDEAWDRQAIGNVLAAYPRSATRMGAALRHAGFRLSTIPAKQRLILLITDGKPMDSEYDANTRYAQHDVRMACEENRRQGIHTFCITTDDNSIADLEIMFPRHRYVILSSVTELPRILPRLYIRLTV